MATKYEAPAVIQASKILKLLSRHKFANSTLTEISNKLEMNRSTCLRVLKSLEEVKFVSYNSLTKTYSLGPYLVILGSRASEQIDHVSLAKTYLKQLVDMTSLTSILVNRISEDRLVYMVKEEINSGHRVNVSVGFQHYITEVSYGMWYLAYMDEKERMKYLNQGLRKLTPHTITDVDKYISRIEMAKEQGYIVSNEEYVMGTLGVSAPIFKSNGEISSIIACIGFSSMTQSEIDNAIDSVKKVSSEFNQMLSLQSI
ncbi:IclR family transcriptional regulator [Oceanobacillus sp. J11TS1]|uniref:IclR family transcriptional regulator n=1 Tax=Oceanobacillus sp. J11TS1 TaxID=2807191 RepID=UPI001B097858|nr:IclR family transcriptional regulator [Oceanobacillus sp. J11TS1]GIO23092.1 hypothetical protein J11TS1_16730 [Oceanobacillus sp. J11TS1]